MTGNGARALLGCAVASAPAGRAPQGPPPSSLCPRDSVSVPLSHSHDQEGQQEGPFDG